MRVGDLGRSLVDHEAKLGMTAREAPEAVPRLGLRRAFLPRGDSGRFIELAELPAAARACIADDKENRIDNADKLHQRTVAQ